MKIKAIVMDMDGTITKFNLDFMDTRRRALKELDRLHARTPDMTDQVSLYIILGRLRDKLDPQTYGSIRSKIYGMLEEMELRAAKDVALYPGAVDVLSKLRDHSVKIGLVTNNGRKGTDLTLHRHKLEEFFDAVITRDDCDTMKPAADPVMKALAEMHVDPHNAMLVGDGVMDIMAAKAAGIPSAAVATGPFTKDRLLQAEPDYLLGSVNDLPGLLDLINAD